MKRFFIAAVASIFGLALVVWPSSIGKSSGAVAPLKDTYANVAAANCQPGQTALVTDSIYSGSCFATNTWNWLWGSLLVTPAPAAGWTWTNQGGSTVATVGGAQVLTMPGSATQWRNYLRTAPATPYTAYLRIVENDANPSTTTNTVDGMGACFGDGSGKFEALYVLHQGNTSGFGIVAEQWSGVNSFSAGIGGSNAGSDTSLGRLAYGPGFNFRLTDDGVNITTAFAADGRKWVPFSTQARTTFFAAGPTTLGLCARLNASAVGSIVTIADLTFQ